MRWRAHTSWSARSARSAAALGLITASAGVLAIGGPLPAEAGAASQAPPANTADGTTAPAWNVADMPEMFGTLTGYAKRDPLTDWATGFRINEGEGGIEFIPVLFERDLRAHTPQWREVPTAPKVTGRINALGVAGPSEAWLVGDAPFKGPDVQGTPVMTQHWNGSSWQVVEAPMPAASDNGGFLDVAARTPNDVWAAGWADFHGSGPNGEFHREGVIGHWDGTRWSQVPLPQPVPSWTLASVSVSGPNDVWAVGSTYGKTQAPVALHYDGRSWLTVSLPQIPGYTSTFNAITAKSSDDVWAVGSTTAAAGEPQRALVMHWNGRTWTRVETPAEAGGLRDVAAARGGVVAVGTTSDRQSGYALRVNGTSVSSLDFPATADGLGYQPTVVSSNRGTVTVAGTAKRPEDPLGRPAVLTADL